MVCREVWSAETMLRRRRISVSAAPSLAHEVLEPSHPVARASLRASRAVERVTGVATFSVAGTILLLATRHPATPSFAFAGTVVTVAVGLAALAAQATVRDAATEAIAVGDDRDGVREFDVARRRLTSLTFRAQLARTLEAYAQAPAPRNCRRVWEPFLPGAPGPGAREAMCVISALFAK
jgi:hypothetical protein